MAIEIQSRDIEIMCFAFKFRVVTYNQIRRKFFASRHESASRNRIRLLAKHGYLKTIGKDSNGLLHKCVSATEKSWPMISQSWDFEVHNPHFRSESVEHDFRIAEVAMKLEQLSIFKNLITENLLQSSSQLATHPHFRDLVNLQSDAALQLMDKERNEYLYAIELEVSKKAPERYRTKLESYYKAGGIDGVLYICGTQEIKDLLARTDREIRKDEPSIVYLALESDVLSTNGKMIFKSPTGAAIGLY